MSILKNPGIHPAVDLSKLEVKEQRVTRKLAEMFHITREGRVKMGKTSSEYNYILAKPVDQLRGVLHTDREVIVLFSDYPEFQPRTIDAFDEILSSSNSDFRIEKVARILVSSDPEIAIKLRKLFEGRPDAPVVIPFCFNEVGASSSAKEFIDRARAFTFSRDLFSVSSPLKSDLYFFGRSSLINEICSKLASGENFGLFGLRRSGKTSLIAGIARALKARDCVSLTVDCQSPSIHQLRWNMLLREIVAQLRKTYSIPGTTSPEDRYVEEKAADTFLHDMATIKRNTKSKVVAILFDEIERISVGSASSDHWNEGRDFLLFWQSIRAGFQSDLAPFTFLIVGTNPTCIELSRVAGSDNPLFGNVQKRYIPMFDWSTLSEMVNTLGGIMGVSFSEDVITSLCGDFGGHPFLTRQVCSQIAKCAPDRPIVVDRTLYAVGYQNFLAESDLYVESVVGMLKYTYEDEHEMLKLLGSHDVQGFSQLAAQDPTLLSHLTGYGLIKKGLKAYYFNIGVVGTYFERQAKPVALLTNSDRISELSARRNDLERRMRALIANVVSVTSSKKERKQKVLSKLSQRRREELAEVSYDVLLAQGASPLYLDELKAIILGHYSLFENSLELPKPEFEVYMNSINRFRADAHAKDISDADFEKVRAALSTIEAAVS